MQLANTVGRVPGVFYWFACLSADPGMSIKVARGIALPLVPGMVVPSVRGIGWRDVEIIGSGSAQVLLGDSPDEVTPKVGGGYIVPVVAPTAAGTLNVLGDVVTLPIDGATWATVRIGVGGGNTAFTAEVSVDGGTNYVVPCYGVRADVVSANPTVASLYGGASVPNSTWEIAIPGNATHFRIRAGVVTTPLAITLTGGKQYKAGVPVEGIVYNGTSGVGGAQSTGTFDFSGWMGANVEYSSGGATTGNPTAEIVSDTGGIIAGPLALFAAAVTLGVAALGRVAYLSGALTSAILGRRMNIAAPAVAAQSTILRVGVWR